MTDLVYTRLSHLLLLPPFRLVYHDVDRRRSVFEPRLEEHFTRCGRLIYRHTSDEDYVAGTFERRFDGIRLDNAELVCRPCLVCYRLRRSEWRKIRPARRSKITQLAMDSLLASPVDFDADEVRIALVAEVPRDLRDLAGDRDAIAAP